MLEQATKNAKEAAYEFAKSSDSKVGKIRRANQGVYLQFCRGNRRPEQVSSRNK